MEQREIDTHVNTLNNTSSSKSFKRRFPFFSKKWTKESNADSLSTVDLDASSSNSTRYIDLASVVKAKAEQENISFASNLGQTPSKSFSNLMVSFRRRINSSQKRSRSTSNRNLNRDKLNETDAKIGNINRKDLKVSSSVYQVCLKLFHISLSDF